MEMEFRKYTGVLSTLKYGPNKHHRAGQQQWCGPQQQQELRMRLNQADSTSLPDSYLFSSRFKPREDLLTLDSKPDHWTVHGHDVRMQQQLLFEARDLQHHRFQGVMALQRSKDVLKYPSGQQRLADVLTVIQQELADKAAVNDRLQQGIEDSFAALGAYLRGMPTLHQQHNQQQSAMKKKGQRFVSKGPVLQQQPGLDSMAGGFVIPAGDDRPGGMSTETYSSQLAPKLLALQQLRQEPCSNISSMAGTGPTGLQQLEGLVAEVRDHRARAGLQQASQHLHQEYEAKHDMFQRLWGGLLSLGIRLQCYMTSSLVLRWHTRWLAGQQMDQPAQWIYDTLRLAASPYACVTYQVWLHRKATEVSSSIAGTANSQATAVHSTLCIANGLTACQFMWFGAPLSHEEDVPGVQKTILGAGGSRDTHAGSPSTKQANGRAGTGNTKSTASSPAAPTAATLGSVSAGNASKSLAGKDSPHKKPNKRSSKRKPSPNSINDASGHQVHAGDSASGATGTAGVDSASSHAVAPVASKLMPSKDNNSKNTVDSSCTKSAAPQPGTGDTSAKAPSPKAKVQDKPQMAPAVRDVQGKPATWSYAAAAATFAATAPKQSNGPRRVSADLPPADSSGSGSAKRGWDSRGSRSFNQGSSSLGGARLGNYRSTRS